MRSSIGSGVTQKTYRQYVRAATKSRPKQRTNKEHKRERTTRKMTPKQARGQLRQIAKELLPEVLAGELFIKLQEEQNARLSALVAEVQQNLKAIDQRQRDMQNMIVRELTSSIKPPETQGTPTDA
jgi:ABC-type transporter Mla subunit MlaD